MVRIVKVILRGVFLEGRSPRTAFKAAGGRLIERSLNDAMISCLSTPHLQDVSVAAILVASKVEDTLKKLRDIQIAAYQITNIMEGGPGVNEGDLAVRSSRCWPVTPADFPSTSGTRSASSKSHRYRATDPPNHLFQLSPASHITAHLIT